MHSLIFTLAVTTMKQPQSETPKRRLGQWKAPEVCLGCDRADSIRTAMLPTSQIIQGEEIHCKTEKWHCTACGAEWMSPAQATAGAVTAVETYQRKYQMLIGTDTRSKREILNWTQEDLARESGAGIATVKRLESGVHVLSKLLNDVIASSLENVLLGALPVYQVTVACQDFGNFCPSLPASWEDEKPWNDGELWMDKDYDFVSAVDSHELALAV